MIPRRLYACLGVLVLAVVGCGEEVNFATAKVVCVQPQALDFGEQTLRTESVRALVLSNCGEREIFTLAAAVVPAADADPVPAVLPFSLEEAVIAAPLGVGQYVQLTVRFGPLAVGPAAAQLEFSFPDVSANEQPLYVALSGVGLARDACDAVFVETEGASFGDVPLGEQATQDLTILNQGLSTCGIHGARITEGIGEFHVEGDPAASLGPGASVPITVAFAPTQAGPLAGRVSVIASERDPTGTVWLHNEISAPLAGNGLIVDSCELSITPEVVVFPRATTNAPTTTTTARFQMRNRSLLDCTVASITVLTGTEHFSITAAPAAGDVIGPDETRWVDLQFAPVEAGPLSGTVRVDTGEGFRADVPLTAFADPTPGCALAFDPNPLTFAVSAAGLSEERDVEIRNVSVVDCGITDMRITPDSGLDFEIVTSPLPLSTLAAGASVPLRVRFTPQSGAVARGQLAVEAGGPPSLLDLLGTGALAEFVLTPPETFFQWITEGCASEARNVTLTNVGSVPGRIDAVEFSLLSDPTFELLTPVPPGTMLAGGTSLQLRVRMVGATGLYGGNYGEVLVHSTGTIHPTVRSGLFAETESVEDATRVDVFLQQPSPTVDILFVIDNSGSMGDNQQNLAANFPAFVSYFVTQTNIDYHIGVTTTDVTSSASGGGAGYLVGPVITRNTTNMQQEFVTQVTQGDGGSYDEQGLIAGALAVSSPLADPSGHNAGFIRPEALLAVIWLSDEEDHSPGAVSNYVNTMLATKGYRADQVIGYAIAGDVPIPCDDAADAGTRYLAASVALGGDFFSICDPDWASKLSAIAWGIGARLSDFELSRFADPDSVVVLVTRPDGTVYEVPRYDPNAVPPQYNGWSVDPVTNVVTFHGNAVPEANERDRGHLHRGLPDSLRSPSCCHLHAGQRCGLLAGWACSAPAPAKAAIRLPTKRIRRSSSGSR